MTVLLFVIFALLLFALEWLTDNIVWITLLIILAFCIGIIRNLIDFVQNYNEDHYIDGELIGFIIVKIVLCVVCCMIAQFIM